MGFKLCLFSQTLLDDARSQVLACSLLSVEVRLNHMLTEIRGCLVDHSAREKMKGIPEAVWFRGTSERHQTNTLGCITLG